MNRITLVGRMVRDPELRKTTEGKDVVEFTIAVPKRYKPKGEGPDADFFRVKAWEQTARYIGDFIRKGRTVSVDGRMESRKYDDREGNPREVWEVIADNVSGIGPREESEGQPTSSREPNGAEDDDPFGGD